MLERIIGVFKLDPQTFEEVEHDPTATSQAAQIVGLVALLSGTGAAFGAAFGGDQSIVIGFVASFVSTFVSWIVWSVITFVIGTNIFGGKADVGEMLRVIGFASAPQLLGIIPCLGGLVGWIWSLIAGFIAVRQGLDLDNTKTALTIGIGFLGFIAVHVVISLFVGGASVLAEILD